MNTFERTRFRQRLQAAMPDGFDLLVDPLTLGQQSSDAGLRIGVGLLRQTYQLLNHHGQSAFRRHGAGLHQTGGETDGGRSPRG